MEPADRKRLVDRGYHFTPQTTGNVTDVGLLKSTILPSFALNSTLSLTSYLLSRSTQTGEIKDWFWPTAQVANAWWSALGSRMYHDGISLSRAWSSLSWTEKLLLSLVSIWGTRLFYRISKRTITRGKDDPRYEELKAKDPEGFWSSALYKHFLPEAVFLTFISLPFTVPFRLGGSAVKVGSEEVRGWLRALGVGLFGAGFAMEVIADKQLDVHRKEGRKGLCRTGVWSIVRHPNYFGDTLVHCSFGLLNAANKFNPVVLLGPVANYVYLRCVGGDKQNEASQEERYKKGDQYKYQELRVWRGEKNSFWPGLSEVVNPWTWVVVGSGMVGWFVGEAVRAVFVE